MNDDNAVCPDYEAPTIEEVGDFADLTHGPTTYPTPDGAGYYAA